MINDILKQQPEIQPQENNVALAPPVVLPPVLEQPKNNVTQTVQPPIMEGPAAQPPALPTQIDYSNLYDSDKDSDNSSINSDNSVNHDYPNEDYLYDKITSNETTNNIKIYICAFTIDKELTPNFVKYLVERKESSVLLPSFTFISDNTQQLPVQQPLLQQPLTQQPLLQQPLTQQPLLQQPLTQQPLTQQFIIQIPAQQLPAQQQQQQQQQQPLQQQPLQQAPVNMAPLVQEPLTQQPLTQQPLVQQPLVQQPLVQQQPQAQQQPLTQQQPQAQQPQAQLQPVAQQPQKMYGGAYIDSANNNDDPLDISFKTKITDFVKSMYQNPMEIQPKYKGYIPNVSEPNSIFAFVNIENATLLKPEYIESTPNELFFLFKVFNLDVDPIVKTLFSNNKWLLYIQPEVSSPFSGYICKLNEQNQIVNVKKEELTNGLDQFLIDIDSIGHFYYFSFLPLDPQNAESYQRFAFFPMEYSCILDENQLSDYKSNTISYSNNDSVYLKGELLTDKKEGQQFFAIKTPSQFTHY
jgi:hypothetical protein